MRESSHRIYRRKPGIEGWSCATCHRWVGTEIPVQITTFVLLTAPCANKSRWFVFFYFRLQLRSFKSRFSVLRQQNSIWRRWNNREIASIDVFLSVAQWITSFAAVLRLGSSLKTTAKKAIHRTKCKEFVSYPELRDTVAETQRVARVSEDRYPTNVQDSVASVTMEPDHFSAFFRHVSYRNSFGAQS